MKSRYVICSLAIATALLFVVSAEAQQRKLTLTDVHICCPGCANAITKAIEGVNNISVEVDRQAKTVTLIAGEGASRQDAMAALEALAEAGFYGKSSHERFKMKDESEGLPGTASSLTLSGIHNCCGACNKAIKKVVASVDGTETPEIGQKAREFTVTGNFDPAAVVKALNKAGFYVKVKS